MRERLGTLSVVSWILIGVIVASGHNFFARTADTGQVGSAALAVLAWPLVLTHIHVGI